MPFCLYMVTVIIKYPIEIENESEPIKSIKCEWYLKALVIDGIEVKIKDKRYSIPMNNILAIIE